MSKLKKIRVQHVDRNAEGMEIKTDVDVLTDADCITMDDGDLRSGIMKMINNRVGEVIDGAPEQLDTLKEIATELEKNQSGVSTILNKMNSKLEAKDLTGYAKTVDVDSKINRLTKIDLSKYAKTSYVDDKVSKIDLSGYAKTADVDNKLNNKVDKENGKQLSTNDYTSRDKTIVNDMPRRLKSIDTALGSKADKTDIKTSLSELSSDASHRTVTDEEKKKWNSVEALTTQEVEGLCDEIFK